MRATHPWTLLALFAIFCTSCSHKSSFPPLQAQAPPLQTGKGTLSPPDDTQQQEKPATPLASPLPPPSAQSVQLPPPPPPTKVRRKRVKTTTPAKPAEPAQAPAEAAGAAPPYGSPGSQASAQVAAAPQRTATGLGAASPIGQLTTGDSATGEKTKHETTDLMGETQQGLNRIKRALSTEEKATAAQIRNYLKQAEQALDTGDTDGAHLLAEKAKTLLDELVKP